MNNWHLDIGATVTDKGRVRFRVWAPKVQNLSVRIISVRNTKDIPLKRDERGYFSGTANDTYPGDLYSYVLENNIERPDHASRFQPHGVHGP